MTSPTSLTTVIAGSVDAQCSCCVRRHTLVGHPDLGRATRVCPSTGTAYLDRGDGVFEAQSEQIVLAEAAEDTDLLSDRPVQTGPKTRIELERATFAGGGRS